MKKILIVILCMLMIFTMTACGDNGGTEEPVDNPTVEQGDDKDTNTGSSKVTMDKLLKISETEISEDFYFMSDAPGECVLASYDGTEDLVYVPSQYDGQTVVAITKFSLANDTKVKGIRFPDSVREIEDSAAVNNANLQVVYLGEGTKAIGEFAFQNCKALYDVRLNDGLEKIDSGAFTGCDSLKSITIPASVTEVDPYAFTENLIIRGEVGSAAETFANEQGYTFEAIN